LTHGVNIIGYHGAPTGLGAVARLVAESLAAAGIPHTTVQVEEGVRPPWKAAPAIPHDVNLVCVNADMLPRLVQTLGVAAFDGRRTIGFWWWEVERFPAHLAWAAQLVDEIWVGSDHVRAAVAAVVPRPVSVFPLPVPVLRAGPTTPAPLDLPDRFRFLFSFNYASVFERKNPLGAISAFARAFAPGEASLVIKTAGGELFEREVAALEAAAGAHPDVVVIDRSLASDEYSALTACADAYVSLHRAEGFGLTIAEAMTLGKPAIATAYSGNLEFMTEENSYLVPYSLVPIPPGTPYPVDARWAEPDLDEAAKLLRAVYDDRDEAARRGEEGRRMLAATRSVDAAASFIAGSLADGARRPHPVRASDIAAATALRGPDLISNRRWLLLARKLAQPLFRPYVEHDVEVTQLLLDALTEERDALEHRLTKLEVRLDELQRAVAGQPSSEASSSET
jgi:glycosyltransferase involved in cell wall biosynthesis